MGRKLSGGSNKKLANFAVLDVPNSNCICRRFSESHIKAALQHTVRTYFTECKIFVLIVDFHRFIDTDLQLKVPTETW